MRVIFKQTGQTGTIPDDKFDPAIFTKIEGDIGSTGGARRKPSVGGFGGNLLSDFGENLEGFLALPGVATDLITGKLSVGETASAVGKGAVDEYTTLAKDPLGTAYDKPVTTALNILPFLPIGKALKVGKAAKAAKAAKATKAAKAGYTPIDDLVRAAAKAEKAEKAARLKDPMGRLERTGRTMRETVIAPPRGRTAKAASQIDEAMKFQKERGYKGSVGEQLSQIGRDADAADALLKVELAKHGSKTIKAQDILNEFNKNIDISGDISRLSKSNLAHIHAYEKMVHQMSKNGMVTVQDALNLKLKVLFPTIKKAKEARAFGHPYNITPKTAAANALYESINKPIGKIAPTVQEVLKKKAKMHNLAKGATGITMPKPTTHPFLRFIGALSGAGEKVIDTAGRGFGFAGKNLKADALIDTSSKAIKTMYGPKTVVKSALEGKPYSSLLHALGRNIPPSGAGGGAGDVGSLPPPLSLGGEGGAHPLPPSIDAGDDEDDEEFRITPELVAQAHLELDPKEAAKVAKAYEMQKPSQADQETRKRIRQLETAKTLARVLSQELLENHNIQEHGTSARISGMTRNLLGHLGLDPRAANYKKFKEGIRVQMARQLGEVGNLSEPEQKAAMKLLPDYGMSKEEIVDQLRLFELAISAIQENMRRVETITYGY